MILNHLRDYRRLRVQDGPRRQRGEAHGLRTGGTSDYNRRYRRC
jgi:hypothetical protein